MVNIPRALKYMTRVLYVVCDLYLYWQTGHGKSKVGCTSAKIGKLVKRFGLNLAHKSSTHHR